MSIALDDKLACLVLGIGTEMGDFLKCLITAEIASLVDERDLIDRKILRLQAVLSGSCADDVLAPT